MLEDTIVEEDIHPAYVSAGLTNIGRVRTSNQDAFTEQHAAGLWTVADGMGGYRDGDVAARMVCEALAGLDPALAFEDAVDAIRQRMSDVNERLYGASVRAIDPVVSGSTVAMFLTRRTSCALLWAGDSRVYRLRHRKLSQLTTDHTWAAEMNLESAGDEADHAITRAVGGEDTLLLDVRRDRVRLGDRFLLCSDGLTRELTDAQIASALAEGDVQQCAARLVEATLEAGARDNVTVVVIDAQ
ncbi:MAG: PP2C family protein-serine/threonine phosphatase [Steroidobacter sp.]